MTIAKKPFVIFHRKLVKLSGQSYTGRTYKVIHYGLMSNDTKTRIKIIVNSLRKYNSYLIIFRFFFMTASTRSRCFVDYNQRRDWREQHATLFESLLFDVPLLFTAGRRAQEARLTIIKPCLDIERIAYFFVTRIELCMS